MDLIKAVYICSSNYICNWMIYYTVMITTSRYLVHTVISYVPYISIFIKEKNQYRVSCI